MSTKTSAFTCAYESQVAQGLLGEGPIRRVKGDVEGAGGELLREGQVILVGVRAQQLGASEAKTLTFLIT